MLCAVLFSLTPPTAEADSTGPLSPQQSLESLAVGEGLVATLFANEPEVRNPAVIDIDERGRVWAAEGLNYRKYKDLQPGGDRIVILEDTDGDGHADSTKTYYQGHEIDNALGLCVLGNRLIVSRSPDVFVFTDEDGDDRPDRIEKLFTGVSGEQHDHGIHSFVFGPDGKLYFNMGNEGKQLLDKDGKPIVDRAGNLIQDEVYPYREGMIFRCDLDGGEIETLAWNFRNNYEVAVDSFGTMWQSDNDDDGNRGVRINYVMQYGNYGYRDEITGGNWREERPNWEKEIPLRHWHLNDPGVVPNLLQTGAGSPTGLVVYEGELLPEPFQGEMIHCDAGPNVVRSYPVEPDGAGYKASIVNVLHSEEDTWFRPADVCVAPDGSLLVADWYDPGVGGHDMGDHDPQSIRGRIYRVAPLNGGSYQVPGLDLESAEGCARALVSPNQATRFLGWTRLREMGNEAETVLQKIWEEDNPRHRARALQLLARIEGKESHYLEQAAAEKDPNLRKAALRIAKQTNQSLLPLLTSLVEDENPQVRRECALALRHCYLEEAPRLWAQLAHAYPAGDRWYLEALGIGADRQETAFLQAWRRMAGKDWDDERGRDIVWRSRSPISNNLLADLICAENTPAGETDRYVRALHFTPEDGKQRAFHRLLNESIAKAKSSDKWALVGIDLLLLSPDFRYVPVEIPVDYVQTLLDATKGSAHFVRLIDLFKVRSRGADLLAYVYEAEEMEVAAEAAKHLLGERDAAMVRSVLFGEDAAKAAKLVEAFGAIGSEPAREVAKMVLLTEPLDASVYQAAVNGLARDRAGAKEILDLAKAGKLPPSAKGVASLRLNNVHSSWTEVKEGAARYLPLPQTREGVTVPSLAELAELSPNPENGHKVYQALCLLCHKVGGEGTAFGPELSDIGNKLGKDALFASIVDPSAGISFGYETTEVEIASGTSTVGYVVAETEDELTLKEAGGIEKKYAKSEIENRAIQRASLMPEGLTLGMTAQDFADLLEYLSHLKTGKSE
jgi:putative membrane-bound dehydrogenase-like protein